MSKIKKASVATIASLSGLILSQQAHADVEKSSTKVTTKTEKIKFKQQIVQDPNMHKNERRVVRPGVEGERVITTEVTTNLMKWHEPIDLLTIIDASSSMNSQASQKLVHDLSVFVNSLSLTDRVQFAFYGTNDENSYNMHPTGGNNEGFMTKYLTKDEAVEMIKVLKNFYENSEIKVHNVWQTLNGKFSDKLLKQDGSSFEDAFAKQARPKTTKSVIQFTDGWTSGEKIDSSFATWAKKNAKTFMSVIYPPLSTEPVSETEMKRVGHPNIFNTYSSKDDYRVANILKTFENTATELRTEPPVLSEKITKQPVDEIVHVGTGELDDVKAKHEKELRDIADKKLKEIDGADILPEDKQRLKDHVNDLLKKGLELIKGAKDIPDANKKRDEAIRPIRDLSLDKEKENKRLRDEKERKEKEERERKEKEDVSD